MPSLNIIRLLYVMFIQGCIEEAAQLYGVKPVAGRAKSGNIRGKPQSLLYLISLSLLLNLWLSLPQFLEIHNKRIHSMLVKFTPVLKRKILNDLTKVITHISCKRHYFCSCLTFPLLKGICALCEPFPFRRLCLWKMCFILLCRPESLIKISCSKHL